MIVLFFENEEEKYIKQILSSLGYELLPRKQEHSEPLVLSLHGLNIYPKQRKVFLGETEIRLTRLEFDALLYMVKEPGRVFTRTQIYNQVCGDEPVGDVDNIIYCLIRSIRKKIEPDPRHPRYIHTIRGVGYKFEMS